MDLIKYRKLLSDSAVEPCVSVCVSVKNFTISVDSCLQYSCVNFCPEVCGDDSPPSSHHGAISRALVISLVFLATTFCMVLFSVVYYKFHQRRNSRLGLGQQQQPLRPETDPTGDDDDDGDRNGPVVDHHVWYIRTVGLNPSIINSIAVLKYNKDDGIVEGTDCSVCLSEFEKDESVRLLPKCNHAFHISCIDTWLRSHTNCPNCRAPIVINSEADSGTGNNSEMVILDISSDNEESPNIRDEEEDELAVDDKEEDEEESVQPTRRSVSLDSLSALKIRQGIANLNSELESGLLSVNSVTKAEINHNLPLSRSILGSSSSGRYLNLQNGQATSLKRSITWNGKFLLSRNSRGPNPTDQP